jgi:hypothetical protein
VIAFDLMGGVLTNASATAKSWYHRPGQGWLQHLGFVSVHFIHLLLVAWLFHGMDWVYFLVFYVYLMVASLVITQVRLYLQRPVALLLFVIALLINYYVLTPVPGLEWFIPVFSLKLLVSHLVKEVPYPAEQKRSCQ